MKEASTLEIVLQRMLYFDTHYVSFSPDYQTLAAMECERGKRKTFISLIGTIRTGNSLVMCLMGLSLDFLREWLVG